jgi:hypothetical protein
MGLLEYQAIPSFREVDHRWLCAFIIEQQLEIPSALSWAAPVRATGTVRKEQALRLRPVRHVQNHTCRVTLLQTARRVAVLSHPSSLRPHCSHPQNIVHIQYSCVFM